MSSLLQYHIDNGQVATNNDLGAKGQTTPLMSNEECLKHHYYVANAPLGFYFDLSQKPDGGRPVRKTYEVGKATDLPQNTWYKDTSDYGCHTPCWHSNCR